MDWMDWKGKEIFVRLKCGKVYSGIVKDVDTNSLPIIWITILDKFKQIVQFTASEIIEIKEDKLDDSYKKM